MFKSKGRHILVLGALSAIPFTLWATLQDIPVMGENGGIAWLLEGSGMLFLAFAVVSCWNAIGAAALMSLVASSNKVPQFAWYAGAFIGALLATCAGKAIARAVYPLAIQGVTVEAALMMVINAALLTVGFYYLDHRPSKGKILLQR